MASAANAAPRVAFVTLGCAKNEVDTDRMRALVRAAGIEEVAEIDDADVAVVNTCSFLVAAVEEGIETIFDVLANEGFSKNDGKVIVAGCMPARYGDDLSGELKEAAAFLPCADEDRIVELVCELTGFEATAAPEVARGAAQLYASDSALRCEEGPSAYVKISDGCNRFCSFCTIPYIRGRYHSRPAEDIAAEVAGLAARGVREIVLIGQDTGVWGSDFDEPAEVADLLEMLAERYPDLWIRVLYLQPEGITDRLLDVVGGHANIASYFDIPVQHANARVVRDMNRTGDAEAFLEVVNRIRERIPDATLRTTVMAGFPGETEDEFEDLCDFLEEARFDYTGVFAYSTEDGTVAGRREDQVDEDVREERADALRDIADRIGFEMAARHLDEVVEVMVEGLDEDDERICFLGRTMGQAPEVDGQVHIVGESLDEDSLAPGDIVRVRIDDAYCYELEGEVVK